MIVRFTGRWKDMVSRNAVNLGEYKLGFHVMDSFLSYWLHTAS